MPAATVLRGRHVELSVASAADAGGIFAALDDDRVWVHVAGRPVDADGWAALIAQRRAASDWCPWTVRLLQPIAGLPAGAVVGSTSYLEVDPGAARGEIGATTYAPAVWATSVNPECKLLLLTFAFEELGFGRVQLKTDIRNLRSQRAIDRLGARYEGVLRRYQRRADGSVRDTVLFSITAEDWPGVRAGLRARLG